MNKIDKNSIIVEIQNEYKKINNKWLKLHYFTFNALVLFGLFVESILGMSLYVSGYIDIPLSVYALKYIISPLIVNLCLILIGFWAMHSSRLQQHHKVYFIALLFVGVCFVFFTVHSIFYSLYLIFTLPILLTVVYSDYQLTTVIACTSIGAKLISELFIIWDADKVNPLDSTFGITDFVISICIFFAFYVACMIVIRFGKEKNFASIQKEIERYHMQHKLITDELTKIYNRTALRKAFKHMEKDSADNKYAFVMIDLDNFKTLNDTLGHEKGDACLTVFGEILRKNCADSVPFRYGGDEFCILFKNKTAKEIMETCKRIQYDLKENAINELGIPLTASFGIAHLKKQMTATELLQNTDAALYRSKELKNTICVYDDISHLDRTKVT